MSTGLVSLFFIVSFFLGPEAARAESFKGGKVFRCDYYIDRLSYSRLTGILKFENPGNGNVIMRLEDDETGRLLALSQIIIESGEGGYIYLNIMDPSRTVLEQTTHYLGKTERERIVLRHSYPFRAMDILLEASYREAMPPVEERVKALILHIQEMNRWPLSQVARYEKHHDIKDPFMEMIKRYSSPPPGDKNLNYVDRFIALMGQIQHYKKVIEEMEEARAYLLKRDEQEETPFWRTFLEEIHKRWGKIQSLEEELKYYHKDEIGWGLYQNRELI